ALLPDRIFDDLLAEGGARRQPLHHLLQRFLGLADGAHAMMDAAWPKAALGDLESPSLAEQDVAGGNAHLLPKHLRVPVRRIVEAEYWQQFLDGDARRIQRHQDLRLLLMARRLRVGLAHQDRDLAAGIADPRRPPFAAVDDIVITVALDPCLDIG